MSKKKRKRKNKGLSSKNRKGRYINMSKIIQYDKNLKPIDRDTLSTLIGRDYNQSNIVEFSRESIAAFLGVTDPATVTTRICNLKEAGYVTNHNEKQKYKPYKLELHFPHIHSLKQLIKRYRITLGDIKYFDAENLLDEKNDFLKLKVFTYFIILKAMKQKAELNIKVFDKLYSIDFEFMDLNFLNCRPKYTEKNCREMDIKAYKFTEKYLKNIKSVNDFKKIFFNDKSIFQLFKNKINENNNK